MKLSADIHIHSYYSRATSKSLNFEHLSKWAQLKGLDIVGTGDVAHPGWLAEMREKLEPAEDGLFKLKEDFRRTTQDDVPASCERPVRFMLAGEISNIYKKNEKVRKIHTVAFMPSLEAVQKLQIELEKIGNIRSDGRPILGLDVRDLLEIILETDPRAHMIPAHIWTPWFSLFGSMSGFDTIEECFEDLTPHIFALETGLSSDPPMNWRLSALDRYTLVSNSDAHSPQKLAREVTLFDTERSYDAIFDALKSGDPAEFLGTVEFFPEEGKYHMDGHRKCGVCWDPSTTVAHESICSGCGKRVTVGVMHRVQSLADRPPGGKPESTHPFYSIIPLPEIISELTGVGVNSKKVQGQYMQLLKRLGPELHILRHAPLEDIRKAGGERLAEGIAGMRRGDVHINAGFDGEFGVIKVFHPEIVRREERLRLFDAADASPAVETPQAASGPGPHPSQQEADPQGADKHSGQTARALNEQQETAVCCVDAPLIILAGPGTGKTQTLTQRISRLIEREIARPQEILAITFTNRAAEEMQSRLGKMSGAETAGKMTITTFHALGAQLIREQPGTPGAGRPVILADPDRRAFFNELAGDLNNAERQRCLDLISAAKNQLMAPDSETLPEIFAEDTNRYRDIYARYELMLASQNMLDFDDLILKPVRWLTAHDSAQKTFRQRWRWISVDEFQDINHAQYQLLKLLADTETNLCVIGDPDQAIYGFRGASPEYFRHFQDDFPRVRKVRLQRSYRSSRQIVSAAGQVIRGGSGEDAGQLWSDIISNTRLQIYPAPTDRAEAEYVVHRIEQMVGGTSYFSINSGRIVEDTNQNIRSFGDFAVLYRSRAQYKLLEEAFLRSGIPYQTSGDLPLFEQPAVRQMFSAFHLVSQPVSTYHLFNYLHPAAAQFTWQRAVEISDICRRQANAPWELLMDKHALKAAGLPSTKAVHNRISILRKLAADWPRLAVDEAIDRFVQMMPSKAAALQEDWIRRLLTAAEPFGEHMDAFLIHTALKKEPDYLDPRADRVMLMTLHAAKGLEFPIVFIVGCEESLLPYHRDGKPLDIDEERRLLYVGMTRAETGLILTHAKKRLRFGKYVQNAPSRYLKDIEATLMEFLQYAALAKKTKPTAEDRQLSLF